MKPLMIPGIAVLFLMLVAAATVFTQDDHRGGPEEKPRGASPASKKKANWGQDGQQRERAMESWPQKRAQQQARLWQENRGWVRSGAWQPRNTWWHHRAQRWSSQHRTWAQRGGYGGYLIPQDRFQIDFGSQNTFRIRSRPTIYMGYPRFVYRDYSFLMVDPWPEYWSATWYEFDDVYVDYNDGYYLHNRRDPQARIAISIVL